MFPDECAFCPSECVLEGTSIARFCALLRTFCALLHTFCALQSALQCALVKRRAPSWIPRLPIDKDMYRYAPPCLGTDVPAVAGSRSLCILAQGMRLGLVGIGQAVGRRGSNPSPERVWSGLH